MSKIQCFKIKRGTDFDRDVKRHFELRDKWSNVFPRVSELLNEEIHKLAFETDELYVDISEIKNEENLKLFTKDGKLKKNSKKANQVREDYIKIIHEEGLEKFEELRFINFGYGVMRNSGQNMESFRDSENDIYYKTDFDLEKKTGGLVEPITEVQYQEKYLEELKKAESETND